MNFELTDERRMLQDGLRRYLTDTVTPDLHKRVAEGDRGFSDEVWAGLADMGVIGALFDEARGGFGGAGFDLALVFEETGRAGAVEPLLDTAVLAGGLLADLGGEVRAADVEKLIEGGLQLALAHGEPGSRYELARVEAKAVRDGGGWRLDGHKSVVVNASAADLVLVSARTGGDVADRDGISLFVVPAGSDGLSLRDYPTASGGRAAEVTLEGVTVGADALLGEVDGAADAIELAHARATLAISAEALGLMESIKTLTVDYLKTRKQFGRPIGEFQVVQHRMADVAIEIEQARSAVVNLAGHVDGERDGRERHVSACKELVGRVAQQVAEESIQLHGGIGLTMEYALGHLAKRLVLVDHRFGDSMHHLERYIALAVA